MRILWLSNPPDVGSGYGEQTGLFLPRLRDQGHELAVATNWGLQGRLGEWEGFRLYPDDNDWGNSRTFTYAADHQADLTIALCDAWVLQPNRWPNGARMAVWAPIDHYPIPPPVMASLKHPAITPMAMSRFGEELMRKDDLDPCYVPHGVDTSLFAPRPELRAKVRESMGVPEDAFLVGMVAANKGNPTLPRKAFPQAFHAFARFAQTHDDAWMYAHTEANPRNQTGMSLDLLATACGVPQGRLKFPADDAWHMPQPKEHVALLYQAFDVLLHPSMGEGFGIPIIEAQASGVPVITSNHSAMPELTCAGWVVGGDPWWDALQASFLIVPSIDSIVAALEAARDARGDERIRNAAINFAREYDADLVTEKYWKPTLERLSQPVKIAPLTPNRKMRRAAKKKKVAA